VYKYSLYLKHFFKPVSPLSTFQTVSMITSSPLSLLIETIISRQESFSIASVAFWQAVNFSSDTRDCSFVYFYNFASSNTLSQSALSNLVWIGPWFQLQLQCITRVLERHQTIPILSPNVAGVTDSVPVVSSYFGRAPQHSPHPVSLKV
jgi:hypothetical protein